MSLIEEDAPHGKPNDPETETLVDITIGQTWALRHLASAIERLAETAPDEARGEIERLLAKAREWTEKPLHFDEESKAEVERRGRER